MKMTFKQPRGFSLIEMMVVIAIVATLTFFAAPALRNYFIRSKVVETIGSAAALQNTISNKITEQESVAGSGLGIAASSNLGHYIASLAISDDGVISVTTTADAGPISYTLTPSYSTTLQQITWICAVTDSSYNDLVPSQCRI
jgi:prepilin-type N-terminal cleavage/methylation domain-containing protein